MTRRNPPRKGGPGSRAGRDYSSRDFAYSDNPPSGQNPRSSRGRDGVPRDGASRDSARNEYWGRPGASEKAQGAEFARGLNGAPNSASRPARALSQADQTQRRLKMIRVVGVVMAGLLVARLGWVQVVWGPQFSTLAQEQRARIYVDPARRGAIMDREGKELASTMQARSLTISPVRYQKETRERVMQKMAIDGQLQGMPSDKLDEVINEEVNKSFEDVANEIPKMIKDANASQSKVESKDILDKMKKDTQYEVLVRNVDPDVAADIASKFHGIAADHQDIRQYPNGAIAENVVGKISLDGEGQFGFEASQDAILAGVNGRTTEDVSANGQAIPGTKRDNVPAIDGANVELTLDLDLQTYVQQQLEQAKANSQAEEASAVVLDVKTGEVLAMASSDTIDPRGDINAQLERGKTFDNGPITHPFEPGSVAKIITAAASIEEGLTTPDEVLQVPGSINMSGVTVKDAWDHGTEAYTTTGVFGKSSNVGTLQLAQRVGEDRFANYLEKFGIGQNSGIELPSESAGLLPARSQWSGGTFANLPIGQGMALTLLQMAGVYQAVANDGERIEPRIIKQATAADGTEIEQPAPKRTRVISPESAKVVTNMFRAVTQNDPTGIQQGTGAGGAIEGYQTSGKTGTAQKVDPNTGAYSNEKYWITFAGIAPADDPRFVVALMLDEPKRGVHGEGGQTAAPLFHDIASWLLNRDNVPPSPPMEGQLILKPQG